MSRRLKPMTREQAETALEGVVTFPGQNRVAPDALVALKRSQGLHTRITATGGRAMLGTGDFLGHVKVSFWVGGAR